MNHLHKHLGCYCPACGHPGDLGEQNSAYYWAKCPACDAAWSVHHSIATLHPELMALWPDGKQEMYCCFCGVRLYPPEGSVRSEVDPNLALVPVRIFWKRTKNSPQEVWVEDAASDPTTWKGRLEGRDGWLLDSHYYFVGQLACDCQRGFLLGPDVTLPCGEEIQIERIETINAFVPSITPK